VAYTVEGLRGYRGIHHRCLEQVLGKPIASEGDA
jgi:hypothetical protein